MPGIEKSTRWSVLTQDVYLESLFEKELHVTPLVARVLVARGFTDVATAQEFLSPSLQRDWLDPQCIPGMAEVAARVHKAIVEHQKIAVFGDFDVDGMSSTCLLTLALRRLGADVLPYIPHRFGEGYGLSKEALARVLQDRKPDLIITVDNGIAAAQEVAWLLQQGINVVVTDHHEPADLVPQGVPVTDPKLIEDCPSRELAGAGVALKLVQVLGQLQDQPQLWLDYIDVAMLGTLSDMMMLNKENRALVSEGVKRLQKGLRPGLVALAAAAGQDIAQISADNLPFSIIPRLNAAGRMGTTDIALDLLLTEDAEEATILAGKLEEINAERRAIEAKMRPLNRQKKSTTVVTLLCLPKRVGMRALRVLLLQELLIATTCLVFCLPSKTVLPVVLAALLVLLTCSTRLSSVQILPSVLVVTKELLA